MDDRRLLVTHHAVLIGINAYPDKPLKGAVRDVQEIDEYLRQEHPNWMLNPPEIQMFTASPTVGWDSSSPVQESESHGLIESSELWPTYDNVVSALRGVLSKANSSDLVYIHFSGHGTRVQPRSRQFSNMSTGNLALVLLDKELEGPDLASLLKEMVIKGLKVTLVLDCCFSGSVMRNDSSARFISYPPKIDAAHDSVFASGLQTDTEQSTCRDASMRPNWMIDPDGYTILAACGPTEIAKEVDKELDNGHIQKHGALSYFLLEGLKKLGGIRETQQLIYHYLRAKFRETQEERNNEQNPILYGNSVLPFFGSGSSATCSAPISITNKSGGSLQLEAGQAHGIHDGDHFTLYPWSSDERQSYSERGPVIAKVVQTKAFVSSLELIDTSVDVRTGWIAIVKTCSLYASLIRLDPSLPRQDEWLTALHGLSFGIASDQAGESVPFHIRLKDNNFEILDEGGSKLDNLPSMKQEHVSIKLICDMMVHLAKFRMVRELINRESADSFQQTFAIHIKGSEGIPEAGAPLRVRHNTPITLEIENKGNTKLYLYVFDMGPCWQVKNIIETSYIVVPSSNAGPGFRSKASQGVKMTVPTILREKGQLQCTDIIKVFVTTQPTSFDLLELPRIGESTAGKVVSGPRGESGYSLSEDWATFSFHICTYIDLSS